MAKLVDLGITGGTLWWWRIEELQDPFAAAYYDEVGLCTKAVTYGSSVNDYVVTRIYPDNDTEAYSVTGAYMLEAGQTYTFYAYAKSEGYYYPIQEGCPCVVEVPSVNYAPDEPIIGDVRCGEYFDENDVSFYYPCFSISAKANVEDVIMIEVSTSMHNWDNAYIYSTFLNTEAGSETSTNIEDIYAEKNEYPSWATTYYIRAGIWGSVYYYSGIVQITTPPDPRIMEFPYLHNPTTGLNPCVELTIYDDANAGTHFLTDYEFDYYLVTVYRNGTVIESTKIYKSNIDHTVKGYKFYYLTGTEEEGTEVTVKMEVEGVWQGLYAVDRAGERIVLSNEKTVSVTVNQWRPEYFKWATTPKSNLEVKKMSYENDWNALVANITAVVKYLGVGGECLPDDDSVYGIIAGYDFLAALESIKMIVSDKVLTAVRYNIAAYIIEKMSERDIAKHNKGEEVMASYLALLRTDLNLIK